MAPLTDVSFADLLKTASDASEDAVFSIDRAGLISTWTRSAARLFGYSAAEVVGQASTMLLAVGDGQMKDAQIKRFLGGEPIERLHLDVRRNDGVLVPVTLSLVPLGPGRGGLVLARDRTEQREAQALLADSEAKLSELEQLALVGLWVWDVSTDTMHLSTGLYALHELEPLEFDGTMEAYLALVHPGDRASLLAAFEQAVGGRETLHLEYRIVTGGGHCRWLFVRAAVQADPAGEPVALRGIAQDVTDRRQAAETLRRQASLLELLRQMAVAANEATDVEEALRSCIDGVCCHTGWRVGHVSYVQRGRPVPSGIWRTGDAKFAPLHEALDQTDSSSLMGTVVQVLDAVEPVWSTLSADGRDEVISMAAEAGLNGIIGFPLIVGAEVVAVLEFFASEAKPRDDDLVATIWDGVNQLGRVVERTRARDELAHQALHDPLTGLPNRALVLDRLAMALERQDRQPAYLAVIYIDLDDFQLINDRFGHEAGDKVMKAVSRRLRHVVRAEDTTARFGGDEFIVLCDRLMTEELAVDTTERILAALNQPIAIDGTREAVVTVSAGLVVAYGVDLLPEELLRDADSAMQRAKDAGGNCYQIFDAEMHKRSAERLALVGELRAAVDEGELRLLYQPQVALPGQELLGVEALIRWEHPARGLLGPLEFIPLAEESQLIVSIGSWVIWEACHQSAAWQLMRPGQALKVCVNVSAKQLDRPELIDDVAAALEHSGLDPATLCLEITESVLMNEAAVFMEALLGLKRLGVGIAIDDFGTGYSSLAYLRHYPIDVIKIDKGFVDGLDNDDPKAGAVVAAVVNLAHALDLSTVAEGVETRRQVLALEGLGCESAQGYLFARPLAAAAISQMLADAEEQTTPRERPDPVPGGRADRRDRGPSGPLAAGEQERTSTGSLPFSAPSGDENLRGRRPSAEALSSASSVASRGNGKSERPSR